MSCYIEIDTKLNEYEAFSGLDYSYKKMEEELMAMAPSCHFTKMNYESGEEGEGTWWECKHCGHTKDVK